MKVCGAAVSLPSGLQKPGRRTRSRSTPAFTAAVSTTRATYSERRTAQVRDALAVGTPLPPACSSFRSALKARDDFLSPENDTIGILVSTAVEIAVGGKTIKPAGGLSGEGTAS